MVSARLIISLLVSSLVATAQQSDWDRVRQLTSEDRVTVLLLSDKTISGRIQSSTADTLEFLRGRDVSAIRREEIKRVWVRRKGSRWRSALIGAGAGFGIGFAIGAASAGTLADTNNPSFGTRAGMGGGIGLFGAGIGAGLAALAGGSRQVEVYRAP